MTLLSRVIRNDAMKEDPPDIYGWRVVALASTVRLTSNTSPPKPWALLY